MSELNLRMTILTATIWWSINYSLRLSSTASCILRILDQTLPSIWRWSKSSFNTLVHRQRNRKSSTQDWGLLTRSSLRMLFSWRKRWAEWRNWMRFSSHSQHSWSTISHRCQLSTNQSLRVYQTRLKSKVCPHYSSGTLPSLTWLTSITRYSRIHNLNCLPISLKCLTITLTMTSDFIWGQSLKSSRSLDQNVDIIKMIRKWGSLSLKMG